MKISRNTIAPIDHEKGIKSHYCFVCLNDCCSEVDNSLQYYCYPIARQPVRVHSRWKEQHGANTHS